MEKVYNVNTQHPAASIVAVLLIAATVEWAADLFFSFFGG